MKQGVIVDTGPLVAAIDGGDQWSMGVAEVLKTVQSPMVTCEAVLAETWFLLQRVSGGWETVEKWIQNGVLRITFSLQGERDRVFALMRHYQDQPMSVADACLVVMIEQKLGNCVFTLDSHFKVYRHSGRKIIPTLSP